MQQVSVRSYRRTDILVQFGMLRQNIANKHFHCSEVQAASKLSIFSDAFERRH